MLPYFVTRHRPVESQDFQYQCEFVGYFRVTVFRSFLALYTFCNFSAFNEEVDASASSRVAFSCCFFICRQCNVMTHAISWYSCITISPLCCSTNYGEHRKGSGALYGRDGLATKNSAFMKCHWIDSSRRMVPSFPTFTAGTSARYQCLFLADISIVTLYFFILWIEQVDYSNRGD